MSLANWMSKIPDTARLADICMPGSHDAGLYAVTNKTVPMPTSYVVTQHWRIAQQLDDGVRFFDLRVYSRAGALFIGHFAEIFGKGKGDLGAHGEQLTVVLNEVQAFITNPASVSEVVILRFSHIKDANTAAVVHAVQAALRPNLYTNLTAHALSELPIRRARGKVIAIFENSSFSGNRNVATGVFTFARYPAPGVDMAMCGEYSNENDFKKMWHKQLVRLMECRAHHANPDGHLTQLYWTLTGGNILEHTANEGREERQMLRAMLEILRPNIVLHDFCSEAHSALILRYGNPGVVWGVLPV